MRCSPLLLLALTGCSGFSLTNLDDGVPPGTCQLAVPPPPPIPVDETCGVIPTVSDPWRWREEWSFLGAADGAENSSYTPPLVARLADTNADGALTEADHPVIVMIAFPADLSGVREGSVIAVDGVTHEVLWETAGVYYGTGHAIGDVTGDGRPDIVVFDAGRRAILLDADGQQIWRTRVSTDSIYPQSTIADVDGDGWPEVIADNHVLDGRTGEPVAELTTRSNLPYTMPAVGDVDLDGKQEIVYGNALHAHDGTVRWRASFAGDYGHFPAILNADDDPEGEILMVGASRFTLFEPDGTVIYSNPLPRRGGSAPCVGDFDGDGASEIGIGMTSGNLSPDPALFQVVELDGAVRWSVEVTDQSGIAGCSAYDFDGDGALEILYADEVAVRVFDGATGETLLSTTDHASGTVYEYPVIADVDMDGATEILSVRSNDANFPLLTVLGHDGPGWAPAGPVWPLHDFAVTNIGPDGVIPDAPPLYWVEHNTYRARPVIDESPYDFRAAITDVCVTGCQDDGLVRVNVQAHSAGPAAVPGGVGVTLYAVRPEGREALETQTLAAMAPGRVVNLVFEVALGELREAELAVRIDDIGTGSGLFPECDDTNNDDVWGPVSCVD
jgi:hypothetical protein